MSQCAIVSSLAFQRRTLNSLTALYACALLIYSQTRAFAWDESYHLLAAQLIRMGRRPYIDFCFPQSPLNAYWNAAVMRIFGQGWRVPHAFEALFIVAAVWLTADYVFVHFPVADWRFAAAVTAFLAAGLNAKIFLYGTVAQPYGLSLLALVAGFRVSLAAVRRTDALSAGLAGFLTGVAAASSLLTAAAAPVFLVWIFWYNQAGRRWLKITAWCAGALVPFAPVFRLFAIGPAQTWFNLVQYHLHYRQFYWAEATRHDLDVLTSWIDSGAPLILGLLALFGVIYLVRTSLWERQVKAEFYLCAWLAAGLSAELSRAHPTFSQYFLLIVPFVAVLAVAGLYAIVPDKIQWPVALLGVLFVLGLGRALYDDSDSSTWSVYQRLADRVEQVTAPDALVFADEPIYFLTKRTPPAGFELYYTHKLELPRDESALLHIIDRAEVRRRLLAEPFATAYSCDEDDIKYYGLKALYGQRADMEDCSIFWERRAPQTSTAQTPSKSKNQACTRIAGIALRTDCAARCNSYSWCKASARASP